MNRLFSFFVIFCMAFTTATAEKVVVKIGDNEFSSLQSAADCVRYGDVLTLVSDATVPSYEWVTFEGYGPHTLDLNGHNVTGKFEGAIIYAQSSDGELTITGNGKVVNTANGSCAFCATDGGTIIINGGTYEAIREVCYVRSSSKVSHIVVNNGKFTAPNFYYEKDGHNSITVKGGLFNCDKDNLSACVAEGYEVVDNEDEATKDDYPYAVVKIKVAKIGDTKYEKLQDAVSALGDGEVLTLLKDVTIENEEVLLFGNRGKSTLDLNGHNITGSATTSALLKSYYENTELTITGEGQVENTADNSDAFAVSEGGTIIINGGTYKATGDLCYIYTGVSNIIINDGKFIAPNFYYKANGHNSITVNGGLFSCDKENLTDCLADGYAVFDNDEEETKADYPYAVSKVIAKIGDTKYADLQVAAKALKDGDVLKMVADAELDEGEYIVFSKSGSYTLDLNGHNITGCRGSGGFLVSKREDVSLTIKGEGKLENTAQHSSVFFVSYSGTIIIEGGTYKATAEVCIVSGEAVEDGGIGYIVVNGGRFAATKFCYGGNERNYITVKGGLFNCNKDNLLACVAEGYAVFDNDDEATKDDYPYAVRKVLTTPTGVETIGAGKAGKVIKTIENGEIVIIRDGVKFDLGGRKL